MSDGMTEAYRRVIVTKKINKNIVIDIDLQRKAVRIINKLDGANEVELKIKTLNTIMATVNEVLDDE